MKAPEPAAPCWMQGVPSGHRHSCQMVRWLLGLHTTVGSPPECTTLLAFPPSAPHHCQQTPACFTPQPVDPECFTLLPADPECTACCQQSVDELTPSADAGAGATSGSFHSASMGQSRAEKLSLAPRTVCPTPGGTGVVGHGPARSEQHMVSSPHDVIRHEGWHLAPLPAVAGQSPQQELGSAPQPCQPHAGAAAPGDKWLIPRGSCHAHSSLTADSQSLLHPQRELQEAQHLRAANSCHPQHPPHCL